MPSESVSKADILEALLFASEKPLSLKQLARVAGLEPGAALQEMEMLREERQRIGALQIVEVAGGWQLVTKPQYADYIRQLREVPRQRLSTAAFEVLAIVAYRQPATRAEVEQLRGVDSGASLQFLLDRNLLALNGRKDAPGRPWLYVTTRQFLEHFGLSSPADLPAPQQMASLHGSAYGQGPHDLFDRPDMPPAEES